MSSRETLAWIASIVQREIGREITGHVRIEFHEGTVQRIRVESLERIPKEEKLTKRASG